MAGYLDQYMMTPEERARTAAILRNSRHPFAITAQTPAALSQGVQDAIEYPQQKGRDARTYVDNTVNSVFATPRQAGRDARKVFDQKVDSAGNYIGALTPYGVGKDVGDGAAFLGRGVTGAVTPILESVPQAGRDFYDAGADAMQGGGNFVRGILDIPEDTSQGARYSDGGTPVGDSYNNMLVNVGQSDLYNSAKGLHGNIFGPDAKGSLTELKESAQSVYNNTAETISGALTQGPVDPTEVAASTGAPVLAPQVSSDATLTADSKGNVNTGQIFANDSAFYTTPYESIFPKDGLLRNRSRRDLLQGITNAASIDETGTQTGNKRDLTSTKLPRSSIDRNELLIRMGGAILGGASQGNLSALSAGIDAYGGVQDYNRTQLREDEARQLEYDKLSADAAATGAAISNAEIKQQLENTATANQYAEEIASMDIVLAGLDEFGDSVTGLYDGTAGSALDSQSNDPARARRALLRSQMEQITLNETLRNTAKTKGAITDKEMNLFKKPQPKMTEGEAKWKVWIQDRRDALARIHNRLQNNIRVDYRTGAIINAAGVNRPSAYSPYEQAAIDKYTQ